jgi:hypothetical protein
MSWAVLAVTLLVLGYVFYVARLVWIALERTYQKLSPAPHAGQSLIFILTGDKEDCDYDLLWHTQLPALKFLRLAGIGGVSIAHMKGFYREFARTYPELCDGSTLSDWLNALEKAGVAVCERDRIAISEEGLFVLDGLQRTHILHHAPHR